MRFAGVVAAAAIAGGCGAGASAGQADPIRAYLDEQAAQGFLRRRARPAPGKDADRHGIRPGGPRAQDCDHAGNGLRGGVDREGLHGRCRHPARERVRLRLDDRLPRFFRTVPRRKRAITVRQRLGHRSGLPQYSGYGDLERIGRGRAVRNALALRLRFRPGARRAYSNVGYTLLAAIVERVTRRPFASVLRRLVFVPAGMKTSALFGQRRWLDGRLAVGYGNRPPADRAWSSGFRGADPP